MVRRFVEEEEVVLLQHQPRQRDAPFLAARKRADRLEHVVAREQEAAQYAAQLALLHLREAVPQLVQHRLVRVQAGLLLVVVADIDVRAVADGAVVGLLLLDDQPQKRRFAHAVGADEHGAVARAQVQIEMLE